MIMRTIFGPTMQAEPQVLKGHLVANHATADGATAEIKPNSNQRWRLLYASIIVTTTGGTATSWGTIRIDIYDGTNKSTMQDFRFQMNTATHPSVQIPGYSPIITNQGNYIRFSASEDGTGGTYEADYVAIFEVI